MSVKIVVGTSFGDEGKGKIVDHFAKDASIVARFAGGNNAGHTLIHNGEKIVLSLLPSGILKEHTRCVLGQGMVINPVVLHDEIKSVQKLGVSTTDRILISERAHVILPKHINKDSSGILTSKIGTTKRGIGPSYSDKIARSNVRLIDLCKMSSAELKEVYCGSKEMTEKDAIDLDKFEEALDFISTLLEDTSYQLNLAIDRGENVLFEGAQATLLDIDHGTYPFVTSSNCVAGGVCTGIGVGPTKITDVIGITKAYVTRVGGGPFPTEMSGLNGSEEHRLATWLREAGSEYGSVTKRPRRIGWLDLPALRYAKQVNGLTELVVTKLDVLTGLPKIRACTGYTNGTETIDKFPISILDQFSPVYEILPGWTEDISKIRSFNDLPENARNYIQFIEDQLGLNISIVSVGPETDSIISKTNQLSFEI